MLVSLDLETTGFDPLKNKIIEFGAVKFDPADPAKQQTLQFLVNPGIPLPQLITHITKITDQDLKNAPDFHEKAAEIKNFIGDCPIVGHNIQFDTGFLRHSGGLDIDNIEYDTQQMASIILPGLPSYSLEILSKILNLTHKEKHRALDDAIASMELFLKLKEGFEGLPKNLLKKFQALAEKSSWPLKNFLLQIQTQAKTTRKQAVKPQNKTGQQSTTATNFKQLISSILTTPTQALHEIASPYDNLAIELAKTASADTYIAIPHQLFHKIHHQILDSAAKLDLPENYLSPARLEEFERKNFFKPHEISALLKYLIWQPKTKTGLLQEVSLFGEEKNTLDQINIQNPANEPLYQKALQKDQNSPAIITHRYLASSSPKSGQLIIIDFEKFLKTLHYQNSIYISPETLIKPLQALQTLEPENQSIPSLIAKSTILFGIIGIIFRNTSDHNEFAPRGHIGASTLTAAEWQKAKDSIKNLLEISHELGAIKNGQTFPFLQQWKKCLTDLHAIFFTPDLGNHLVWIEKNMQDDPFIKKIPVSLKDNLQKLLQNFSNYQLIDESLDLLDEGEFAKEASGLPEPLPLIKHRGKNENLKIAILEKEYDKNQIINTLIEYLKKTENNSAIIFNSKKELEFFTLKFSQAGLPIISQITASLGKLQEQFTQSQSPITLLLTPNTWHNLENSESIRTLFIHKLPFDPPSDPILAALSRNYRNAFTELQIPRAILALRKILKRLGASEGKKQAFILDPRIITRDYGQAIYKNLEVLGVLKTINLKEGFAEGQSGIQQRAKPA